MSEPVKIVDGKYFISNYEVVPCIFKPFLGLHKHEDITGFRTKERISNFPFDAESYLFYKERLPYAWTEDMIIEYTLL